MSSILVVGETCKDIFVYCKAIRLAPDLPVPVLEIEYKKENPGMAMNVQLNIRQIYDNCDLETNKEWQEITKTRYVHATTNHMFFRIDTPHIIPKLDISKINYKSAMIVISDYNKGFLSESDIEEISSKHDLVFLDTKKKLGSWANNCKFIKINDYEFERSRPNITSILEGKIIHTKGGDGCFFRGEHFPVRRAAVRDSSGAGDAFMGALAVKYIETKNIITSIKFANLSASRVVSEKGVTLLTKPPL
jgi:bifunctional ADP-heptose synthase (sugar kinase/adenylyltransferase)